MSVSKKCRRDQAGREIIRCVKIAVISLVNKKPCGFKDGSWKVSAKRLKFHCFFGKKVIVLSYNATVKVKSIFVLI